MRIRLGVPGTIPQADMAAALDAALEASTASQVPLIATGRVPPFEHALRRYGIRWKPEPPGDEHFDSAQTVMLRGWGDCDDLAPWHAASLRAEGVDDGAHAFVRRSGPQRWHALVRLSDGTIEDPSRWAGMGRPSVSGYDGAGPAVWPAMFPGRSGIAVHPWHSGYAARAEIPDLSLPVNWSAIYTSPRADGACAGAICGLLDAVDCAGHVDAFESDRLGALADLLDGADPDEIEDAIAHIYGEEHSVGFLPALLPAAAALAPVAISAGKKLFGGGGGKKAPAAAAPSGGGGFSPSRYAPTPSRALAAPGTPGPGSTILMPGGTTIVKF
jgi:hypothetical protein